MTTGTSTTPIVNPLVQAQVDELNDLAEKTLNSSPEQSLEISFRACDLAVSVPYQLGLATSWQIIGHAYWLLADYKQAITHSQQALDLHRQLSQQAGEARTLALFANIYRDSGDYEKALDYALAAFPIYESIADKIGLSRALAETALICRHLEQYDTALQYLHQAHQVAEETHDAICLAQALNGIGETYLKMGEAPKALEYLLRAQVVAAPLQDSFSQGDIFDSLGAAYRQLGQHQEAQNYLAKALSLHRDMCFKIGEAATLLEIGNLYFDTQELESARDYYNHALTIATQIKARELLYQIHLAYFRFYELQGHFSEALAHHKLYASLRAEVISGQNQRAVAALQARANLEKAEKERELFRVRNIELASVLEQVETANQQIEQLNQQLKSENIRMAGEVEITQRLQQMVLPKARELNEIEGLAVTGFMAVVEDLGGDFYNVFQQSASVKIAIGDVAGSGLESAIIMMMIQTALHTLTVLQDEDLLSFMIKLNSTIFHNIQRMQSSRNSTLILLDYRAGHVAITGYGEQIILVRTDGSLELIDTCHLCLPLGAVADFATTFAYTKITLAPGDLLVLYTDGVIEAARPDQEQFGLTRLCQLVQDHHQKDVTEIKHAIVEAIMDFTDFEVLKDDLTLLILKQK
jgi:serine phosphatase RsbU (regulator of sigma subunit)